MELLITGILSIICGLIIGLLYSRKEESIHQNNFNKEFLLRKESDEAKINTFTMTLRALGEGLMTEMGVLREAFMSDLLSKQKESEDEINQNLLDSANQLDEMQLRTINAENTRIEEITKALHEQKNSMKKECKVLEKLFHESQEEDVTKHLLSCAYAVVADNKAPRNHWDSKLTNAVIAHRKSAPKGMKVPDPKSGLDSGDLN